MIRYGRVPGWASARPVLAKLGWLALAAGLTAWMLIPPPSQVEAKMTPEERAAWEREELSGCYLKALSNVGSDDAVGYIVEACKEYAIRRTSK